MLVLLLIPPLFLSAVFEPEDRGGYIGCDFRHEGRIDRLRSAGRHEDFHFVLLIAYSALVKASLNTIVGNILPRF